VLSEAQLIVVVAAVGAFHLLGDRYALVIVASAMVLVIGVSIIPIKRRS
jgi:hypothetical protein